MTDDQHQPAAAAPGLSEADEADYLERKWRDDAVSWSMAVEDLKEERDGLLADLARPAIPRGSGGGVARRSTGDHGHM
jgi:hypothetical protein